MCFVYRQNKAIFETFVVYSDIHIGYKFQYKKYFQFFKHYNKRKKKTDRQVNDYKGYSI